MGLDRDLGGTGLTRDGGVLGPVSVRGLRGPEPDGFVLAGYRTYNEVIGGKDCSSA